MRKSILPRLRAFVPLLPWLFILPLFWWTLQAVSLHELVDSLGQLSVWQIAFLIIINSILMLLFSSRWWIILRAQGYTINYIALSAYRLAAFSLSYFTPGPHFGGEPLQVALLQSRHAVPGATAVASVALDKIIEMLSNFTFLVIGVMIIFDGGLIREGSGLLALILALVMLAAPLVYITALWRGWVPLSRGAALLSKAPPLPGWLRKAARSFLSAEKQMAYFCRHQPKIVIQSLAISGLIWAGLLAEYWFALRFLGAPLNLLQAISVITAARIAILLPMPGGLGTLEASQVIVMQALGLSPALGVSISLLIRARDLSFGALGLWLGSFYNPVSKLIKG